MFKTLSSDAIMTSFPIEEPNDSLIIEDEDINTIIEKESDEENESRIENLFHIPSESEVTFDNEKSISNDVNPIYDEVLEDIDCTKSLIDSFPPRNDDISFDFDADPKEIKSLLNHDALITSPKIDPFLDKFAGELVLINPGINESILIMRRIFEIHTFLASNDSKPSVIDSDSYDSKEDNLFLKSNLVVSFHFRNRNKTFDPGISIEA
nr:hypothetical protein [Tanacetum cinerariifolium]